jgi:hypothetical protein
MASAVSAAGQTSFQPWSESLFEFIEKQHGKPGADRMRKLHQIIIENADKPIDVKLRVTNETLNHLPWIADRDKYDQDDYWATPLETITTFGGDCEDIAIAKFMMLRIMGVPKDHLRLTYVKIIKTGEAHMVLAYINDPDLPMDKQTKPVLILDNYVDEVLPGSERKDLLAVYLIDADKKLTLISDDGKNRSVKSEVDSAKFAKLDKIKAEIRKNQEIAKQHNEGRPLF